jgi:hypothetical protein
MSFDQESECLDSIEIDLLITYKIVTNEDLKEGRVIFHHSPYQGTFQPENIRAMKVGIGCASGDERHAMLEQYHRGRLLGFKHFLQLRLSNAFGSSLSLLSHLVELSCKDRQSPVLTFDGLRVEIQTFGSASDFFVLGIRYNREAHRFSAVKISFSEYSDQAKQAKREDFLALIC